MVGPRQADLLLQTGSLVTATKAAAIGLVDEAVQHDQVMDRAASIVKELLSVPDSARHDSKMITRGPLAAKLLADREGDIDHFQGFITGEAVQADLGRYMAALKARSK